MFSTTETIIDIESDDSVKAELEEEARSFVHCLNNGPYGSSPLVASERIERPRD